MAVHQNLWSQAEAVIDEYLTAARNCIEFKKSDGGCLGYPAALVLLCVVNALGTYLRNETVTIEGKSQRITKGDPFRVLNHPLFAQNLRMTQIKRIEDAYRNRLAHNGFIAPGHGLTLAPTDAPFDFRDDAVWISLGALYAAVVHAWSNFDKAKIKYAMETLQMAGLRVSAHV
jgi:hypothetical protein